MKKKHVLNKITAVCLAIVLLVSILALPGCGNKTPTPTGTTGDVYSGSTGQNDTTQSSEQFGSDDTPENTTQSSEQSDSDNTPEKAVKNVIYMIADGGGYDNFTLADKVKEEMAKQGIRKLVGAKTEVTTDLLSALGQPSVSGLYLDELLVGSANTLLVTPHGDKNQYKSYITDSSAAATALSSGYKTNYCYAGIDSDKQPRASIAELARMNGMSTGLVTTKSYVDATPLAFFTAHTIHRHQYQDTSLQALLSGIDVVIGEGTEYGDLVKTDSSHPDVSATTMGYTVARNKTQLLSKADDPATKKLWAPILGVYNSSKKLKTKEVDLGSDHISYDVDAGISAEQPSLLDMTKAALQVLGTNINDPDGFFLMIEGGALDNAAEPGSLRAAVGEYLAFDEAFGYCVNWAAQRGDTIVIAVPDHDSGGFSGIEDCQDALIDSIISGYIGNEEFHNTMSFDEIVEALDDMGESTGKMKLAGGHTDMAVPISLYAPDSIKTNLLTEMTLPAEPGNVRLGTSEYYVENAGDSLTWYTSPALNNDYIIDNTKIAPAIVSVLEMGSLDEATNTLFNKLCHIKSGNLSGPYSGSILFGDTLYKTEYSKYYTCTYRNENAGLSVERNSTGYTVHGIMQENKRIGDLLPKSLFIPDSTETPRAGTFYVPYSILSTYLLLHNDSTG